MYKLFGKKLRFAFKQPESGYYKGMDYYFSKLTLLSGAAKTSRVKFAGVSDPGGSPGYRPQVQSRCFCHVKSISAVSILETQQGVESYIRWAAVVQSVSRKVFVAR